MFVSRISNVINQAPFYKCLELKAEIEKLKAAQRSSQNIDPERYRLCWQEITSLRMKLHQQERHMADMQRWAPGARQPAPGCPGSLSGRGAGREAPGSVFSPPSHTSGAARPQTMTFYILLSGFLSFVHYVLILNDLYM